MMIAANGGTSFLWKAFHKAELLSVRSHTGWLICPDSCHLTSEDSTGTAQGDCVSFPKSAIGQLNFSVFDRNTED